MARVLSMPAGASDADSTIRPAKMLPALPRPIPVTHALTPTEERRLLGKLRQLAACVGRPFVWRLEFMCDHYLGTTPAGVTSLDEYVALREREHYGQV